MKVCHYHINAPDCLLFFGCVCSPPLPPLPARSAVLQQVGPEEDSLQNHRAEVTGLRSLLLSFGNAGEVERDSLSCGTPSGADSAQCIHEEGE